MVARKTYILKLYVAGNTPNSMRALNTLKEILENEFKGVYALKVIDVLKQPQLAEVFFPRGRAPADSTMRRKNHGGKK